MSQHKQPGPDPAAATPGPPMPGVDGLVAAVETKMAELMGWHEEQASAFASEKAAHERELAEQRKALAAAQHEAEQARQRYQDKIESADRQRQQLRQAAEVLRERQSVLEEEWTAAQAARKQAEQTASDLKRQRERASDQTQKLIDAIAGLDSEPIVMADVTPGRARKKEKSQAKRAA